jgi:ribosomal protein L40E
MKMIKIFYMYSSTVSICFKCGAPLSPTAYSFCPNCGTSVSKKNRNKIRLFPNFVGDRVKAIVQSTPGMPVSFIKNTAAGMDNGIDKIHIKSILKKIVDSADDPRIVNVAKSLAKHSPEIAMTIAGGVLTSYGIPSGVVLTPLATAASKHIHRKSDMASDSSPITDLDFSEYVPLIAKAIEEFTEKQKNRPK